MEKTMDNENGSCVLRFGGFGYDPSHRKSDGKQVENEMEAWFPIELGFDCWWLVGRDGI